MLLVLTHNQECWLSNIKSAQAEPSLLCYTRWSKWTGKSLVRPLLIQTKHKLRGRQGLEKHYLQSRIGNTACTVQLGNSDIHGNHTQCLWLKGIMYMGSQLFEQQRTFEWLFWTMTWHLKLPLYFLTLNHDMTLKTPNHQHPSHSLELICILCE